MTDKSRFLITTADMRSWKTDRPVLFLGEWCRLYDKKSVWQKMDAQVASAYGWEKGQKDRDFHYVNNLGESLLVEITEILNSYHGTNHSLRYWRIMLGTWLYRFTALVYNRWAVVQQTLNKYKISGTVVLDFPEIDLIPSGYLSFARLYRMDNWNHAIYGMLLKNHFNVPCEVVKVEVDKDPASRHFTHTSLTLKQYIRRLLRTKILSKLRGHSTDALLIATHLPFVAEFKLQIALGQIPIRRSSPLHPGILPDLRVRERLQLNQDGFTGFEQFIRKIIPKQIPTCYLEGYSALLEMSEDLHWPKNPKFIFTSNSYDGDEVFKAWTASKVESGVPYIIGQHGGNLGAGKFVPSEQHEVATADRYITWGWKDGNSKHHPVCALNLVGKSPGKWNPNGGLLLVERSGGHREEPWDEIPAFKNYIEEQFKFVKRLPTYINKHLTVRLFAAHLCFNWSEDIIWKERSPGTHLDFCLEPIDKLICKNRLTIYSYNSTGVLESLALNIPMLIFWNTANWHLRSSAKSYYDRLKHVGILHENPESAAAKVVEVWADVAGWWEQKEVQEARTMFCNQFACMPEEPIQRLKEAMETTKSTNMHIPSKESN
jgi:putative transferase (TIGR04331 family)